jgi:hypothetical protein
MARQRSDWLVHIFWMPTTNPITILDVKMIQGRMGEDQCPSTGTATSMRMGIPSMICPTPGPWGATVNSLSARGQPLAWWS